MQDLRTIGLGDGFQGRRQLHPQQSQVANGSFQHPHRDRRRLLPQQRIEDVIAGDDLVPVG